MFLSQINIYPIKSMQGISLKEAQFESLGLRFDRRWMLVDSNLRFMTQREYPQLAAFQISILDKELGVFAFGEYLSIPLEPSDEHRLSVNIWESHVEALVYENHINEWFSNLLGIECKLVKIAGRRQVDSNYAVSSEDVVSFADGYPFLLTNQASLKSLNNYLSVPIEMSRFRPNLVISGAFPFAEDDWKKIKIGEYVFHVVKPCSRCIVTTIDQRTGRKMGEEPLKTLNKIRSFVIGGKRKVLFGQNLIADQRSGSLKVGDLVEVIEEK